MSERDDILPSPRLETPVVDETCDRLEAVAKLMDSDRAELADLGASLEAGLERASQLDGYGSIENLTMGERLADRVASFGGSWAFILSFLVLMSAWILWNAVSTKRVDPYPFILLNLMLSCLAALQAPIIMMSQNRQEAKDRIRAQHDFEVNVKAEIEIRKLHEKIDHLLYRQMQRLLEIQRIQTEMLRDARPESGKTASN